MRPHDCWRIPQTIIKKLLHQQPPMSDLGGCTTVDSRDFGRFSNHSWSTSSEPELHTNQHHRRCFCTIAPLVRRSRPSTDARNSHTGNYAKKYESDSKWVSTRRTKPRSASPNHYANTRGSPPEAGHPGKLDSDSRLDRLVFSAGHERQRPGHQHDQWSSPRQKFPATLPTICPTIDSLFATIWPDVQEWARNASFPFLNG